MSYVYMSSTLLTGSILPLKLSKSVYNGKLYKQKLVA